MARDYQKPSESGESGAAVDTGIEPASLGEPKGGTSRLRCPPGAWVFIVGVAISGTVFLMAYYYADRYKKWEVGLLWQKVVGEMVVGGKSEFIMLQNVTYDEQRNLLLVAYNHLVRDKGRTRLELVLEILDASSGRTIQTIVSPTKRPTDKPSLSVRSAGYFANPVVVSVPEENTILLVDRLTLRTYDMSSGAVGASLDLPQREAHWLAVYLPHPNKLFLFDPVRKVRVEKEIGDYWDWDYDVFQVEATQKIIKLKKIVSFRTQDLHTHFDSRVCATCQGRKLVWLRRDGEKNFLEVYDPVAEKFDGTVRTLPPYVAPLLADELRAQLGLWLDEQDWRWLYIVEKFGKDDKEYVELFAWTHQDAKPLGTLRAPGVEGIASFAVNATGTLCAVFGGYTTYVVDVNRMRIVARWTEEKELSEQDCFAGVFSKDGRTVFRFLESSSGRVKVRAYRLRSNDM